MAEFVRAQIFGTTFEITSRYGGLESGCQDAQLIHWWPGTPIYNRLAWEPSVLSGEQRWR
jgi:hypothetical protein